jgi:hypothetical protein
MKKYIADSINQTKAEIKNLFHLIFEVPLITVLNGLLLRGLIRRINPIRLIINGIIITINPTFGLSPRIPISLGLAAYSEITEGSECDLINIAVISGIEPIVLATSKIITIITRYRQNEFLPEKEDSR